MKLDIPIEPHSWGQEYKAVGETDTHKSGEVGWMERFTTGRKYNFTNSIGTTNQVLHTHNTSAFCSSTIHHDHHYRPFVISYLLRDWVALAFIIIITFIPQKVQ